MACGRARTVRVNGLDLALAEWGGGPGTPVVLLHSLAAHRHWWDWTAPGWAAGRRVVALDFRGHGASAHASPPAYTFEDYAGDVVGVLDALGIGRARLLGHSMGGFVGALVAARHPARLEALVIADMLTSWTADQASAAARQASRPSPVFASLGEAGARFRLQPPDTRASSAVLRHLGESGVRATAQGSWQLAFDRAVFLHPPVDPWPFLPKIACPALVIHGESSGLMDRAAAERVAAAIPRSTARTLPGAHHHLVLDAPEAFVAAVDGWLAGAVTAPG
ncbi:MAG: alpha/beta hydrolase [Candidatus Rokubacteria bacterium]|nr:alpha/beta hydrolase [Candidatus Rokubacteria bacterium]